MPATASVFLNVKNLEKSLRFYADLGFRTTKTYKNDFGNVTYADLELQGAELGLGEIGANPDPDFRKWVATPLGAGVMVTFTVPDVDALYAKAQAAGAFIEMPLTDRPYGRTFYLNDPDGYVVSFYAAEKPKARKAAAKKAPARAAKKAAPKKAAKRKPATKRR